VSDLKDTSLAPQKKLSTYDPPGGWSYEPSPPPLRATPPAGSSTTVTTTATVTATAMSSQDGIATAQATASVSFPTPASQAPGLPPAPRWSAWRGTPPSTQPPGPNLAQHAATPWRLLPSAQDPSTMTKDQFMAQGNDAFMKAVRDGKIPKEISDSPAAMQAL